MINVLTLVEYIKNRTKSSWAQKTDLCGFFDGFEQDQFVSGWVQDRNDPTCRHIKIEVCLDEVVVAEGLPIFTREGDLPGYRINTDAKLKAIHIAEGKVRIHACGRDGKRVRLEQWLPLTRAIFKRVFPPEL